MGACLKARRLISELPLKLLEECFWCHLAEAQPYSLFYVNPVYRAAIYPDSEPSFLPNVWREIVEVRASACAIDVFSQLGLYADGHDSVWIMTVQEVREKFAAHPKLDEVLVNSLLNFQEARADGCESLDSRVFNQCSSHETVSFSGLTTKLSGPAADL